MEKPNVILEKTFSFSLRIVELCNILEENRKYAIANQLLRSGTSIGANIREAQNAESQQDFIHKFKIASKEAEETMYWLDICLYSRDYPDTQVEKKELLNIMYIMNSIIGTMKKKIGK